MGRDDDSGERRREDRTERRREDAEMHRRLGEEGREIAERFRDRAETGRAGEHRRILNELEELRTSLSAAVQEVRELAEKLRELLADARQSDQRKRRAGKDSWTSRSVRKESR